MVQMFTGPFPLSFQKLEARHAALETLKITEDDRRKARDILHRALEYVSSEEDGEGVDNGPLPRIVKPLAWERNKLRNIKAALDKAIIASQSPHQRGVAATVVQSEEVPSRPKPKDGPLWAIRS